MCVEEIQAQRARYRYASLCVCGETRVPVTRLICSAEQKGEFRMVVDFDLSRLVAFAIGPTY